MSSAIQKLPDSSISCYSAFVIDDDKNKQQTKVFGHLYLKSNWKPMQFNF